MKNSIAIIVSLSLAVLSIGTQAQSPVGFTGAYSENFDSIGPAGTNLPAGWGAVRYAGSGTAGESLGLGISTGSSTGGGIYNVGSSGDSDRALGVLATGATVSRFGLRLINNSGSAYEGLSLSGTTEQWRTGNNDGVNETVSFEYSLDATGIDDAAATFIPFAAFDLTEILTSSTSSGAVNGNDPLNRIAVSGQITGLLWDDGATLTLRWSDTDAMGNDAMLALDDLNITAVAVPEPSTVALLGLGSLAVAIRQLRRVRAKRA